MPVSYSSQWVDIKLDYEAATDKKKPSESFLGVFKKPTGLEKLFKEFDAALKKEDAEEAPKVHAKLERAIDAYQKVLFKAAGKETDKEVAKDTKVMATKLNDLLGVSEMAWKAMARLPSVANLRDYGKLMKTAAADRIRDHAKKRFMTEQLGFLDLMLKKDRSVKTYKAYIKTNEINIDYMIISLFDEQNPEDGPWEKAIDAVLSEFRNGLVKELNDLVKKT